MAEPTNAEIILYAAWRVGGVGQFVNIEKVYEMAWKLAPSRFGWRSLPFPSDYSADRALREVHRKPELSALLLVSKNRQGLQLSAEGVAWVRENEARFAGEGKPAGPGARGQGIHRRLVALERDQFGQAYASGREVEAGRAYFADLFDLTPDADAHAWRARLESYRSEAERSGRQMVLDFCARLERERPEWFGSTR